MKKLALILALVAVALAVMPSCSKKSFETPDSLVGTTWTASETISEEGQLLSYVLTFTDDSNLKLICKAYVSGRLVDEDDLNGTYVYEKPDVTIKIHGHSYKGSVDGGTLFVKDFGEIDDLYFSRN